MAVTLFDGVDDFGPVSAAKSQQFALSIEFQRQHIAVELSTGHLL